jgi:hypothetical protein
MMVQIIFSFKVQKNVHQIEHSNWSWQMIFMTYILRKFESFKVFIDGFEEF